MKKWSILFAIASLLVVGGCGDNNSSSHDENLPYCGNGMIEGTEQCDDGNTMDGDGCSATCQSESSSTPLNPVCGDHKKEGIEQCDDGNTMDGDGCSATCQSETNEPEQTECPVDGGNCTELWENMCCNGKVFFCDMDNKWHAQTCLTGTECDTIHADFGVGFPDHNSQCVENCASADDGKIVDYGAACFEDNTFDLYICIKGQSGKYRAFRGLQFAKAYCVDETHKAVCGVDKKVEEVACDGCKFTTDSVLTDAICEEIPDSGTPKAGDRCSAEDDGLSVCGQNNTLLECTEGVYELVESCSSKGTDFYCDALPEDEFVACVKSCTAEQEGQVTGYDGCLFGYVNVTLCQRGISGKFGAFGGMGGENVCAPDGTKMVSCVNDTSDEMTEIPCAGGCTMTWDDEASEYISECK